MTQVCSSRRYTSAKRPRQSAGKSWLTFRPERATTRAVGANNCACFADNFTSNFVTVARSHKEFVEDESAPLQFQNHTWGGVTQQASGR